MNFIINNYKNILNYYITNIISKGTKEMIDAHKIFHKGKLENVCYITTAVIAWYLTGEDVIPPFNGKWEGLEEKYYTEYENCIVGIAYDDYDEEDYEGSLDHTFISLNYGEKMIESNLSKNQSITEIKEYIGNDNMRYRCIPINILHDNGEIKKLIFK